MDRTAKLTAGAIAAFVVLVIAVAAYPAVFFGVHDDDLAASLNHELPRAEVGDYGLSCVHPSPENWRCGPYDLDVDWRGCWHATPQRAQRFAHEPHSGCIGVADMVGLHDPVLDSAD